MRETPNESEVVVLWLLPAEPVRSFLQALIARLAAACEAPVFEPHFTLGIGTSATLEGVTESMIHLCWRGIAISPEFTKTLFVRLENTASLRALRTRLGLDVASAYDPHLSLLYCRLPERRQTQLARGIELPFTSIAFDTIAAIRCPIPTQSRADVESWRVVARRKIC